MMNSNGKVYWTKVGDADKWVTNNDSGQLHIFTVPKKWWSLKDWKFCISFHKHFRSGFITMEKENGNGTKS